ncbi:MAG: hypothetical protein K2W95_17550 [Candidatus Obscuribacterales bacterium]|nr:hypothetical protein [Candidatus Obscuribacterales bacterium]
MILETKLTQFEELRLDVAEHTSRLVEEGLPSNRTQVTRLDRSEDNGAISKLGLVSAESLLPEPVFSAASSSRKESRLAGAETTEGTKEKEKEKPDGQNREERKKDIAGLIEQLGDDNFDVRQQASNALLKVGTAALSHLERALQHEDLEIRSRALDISAKTLKEALKTFPADGAKVAALHSAALKELKDTGKLSDETIGKYERPLDAIKVQEMSSLEMRTRFKELQARSSAGTNSERLDALARLDELAAMRRVTPLSQMRLDYADLLIKAGDREHATMVLRGAVKDDWKLLDLPSFNVLAADSGSFKVKSFIEHLKEVRVKSQLYSGSSDDVVPGERRLMLSRVGHLQQELDRKGPTAENQKHFDDLMKAMSAKATAQPDAEAFFKTQQAAATLNMVESLAHHKKSAEAIELMTKLLDQDPRWAKSRWFESYTELTGAENNERFRAAVRKARK